MRRFFPFAALLGVAFVLGCQDVGTGVVASNGPGPQFAKPNCETDPTHSSCKDGDSEPADDPSYTVTHNVDVDFLTADPIGDGRPGAGKQGTSVRIGHAQDRKRAVLMDAFVAQLPGLPDKCFPRDLDDDGNRTVGLTALFRARQSEVTGYYYFQAYGTDGSTPVLYSLDLSGDAGGDPVGPDQGATTTVTWDSDGIFYRQGGDGDVPACVGAGTQGRVNVTISGSVGIMGNFPTP